MAEPWTAGPWFVTGEEPFWEVVTETGGLLADVYADSSQNARLIAAAPDLAEALKDILRIARAASVGVTGNSGRIAKAEAALRKARGEQP